MAVVKECLGVTILLDLVGDGIFVAHCSTNDSEEVGVELAIVRSMCFWWECLEFAADLNGCFEGQGHGSISLDQIAGEDNLHMAIAVLESNENDVFLRSEMVDVTRDLNAGPWRVGGTQFDLGSVHVVKTDLNW